MILQEKLKNIEIVLGSKSPRRKDLLSAMDINFEVQVREIDESFDPSNGAEEIVLKIAKSKLASFNEHSFYNKLVICADTIVVNQNGDVIGKPANQEEALEVLTGLSANEHHVFTAIALSYQNRKLSFVEMTKVWFNDLSKNEIEYYVQNYLPLDKAGSYGIQEWIGRIGIKKIDGSYENVIGLPTARLQQELKAIFLN